MGLRRPRCCDALSAEMQAVLKDSDVVGALAKLGVESAPMPATEFAQFFRTELTDYTDIAREFKISPE